MQAKTSNKVLVQHSTLSWVLELYKQNKLKLPNVYVQSIAYRCVIILIDAFTCTCFVKSVLEKVKLQGFLPIF